MSFTQVRRLPLNESECRGAAPRHLHLDVSLAFERVPDETGDLQLVFHDENVGRPRGFSGTRCEAHVPQLPEPH